MGKTLIVRNAMSRPVEIHFADRVAVMLPGDKLNLDGAELSDPGLSPLVQSGVLSCFEAPAEPPPKVRASRKRRAKAARAAKPPNAARKKAPQAKKKAAKTPPAPAAPPATRDEKKQDTETAIPAPDNAEPTETSR